MWARASALHRHIECPAASWLPRDEHGNWEPGYLQPASEFVYPFEDNQPDNEFAEWGTNMHLAAEGHPGTEPFFLDKVTPHRERMWPLSLGRHEIPVKYNCRMRAAIACPESVLIKGGKEAWKRLANPDEVTGTADWVGNIPSGDLWIDDLKTGYQTPDPMSDQLLFYALCFFKLAGTNQTPHKIVRTSVTHWRRDWDEPKRYWAQVTWLQLEEFEERLVLSWKRASGKSPKAKPGVHCNYCPSLMVCDAINGIEYAKIGELDE